MFKYRLLIILLIFAASDVLAQDSLVKSGRIKISKPKGPIQVTASFNCQVIDADDGSKSLKKFLTFKKRNKEADFTGAVIPVPAVKGYGSPFDFSEFFQKNIDFEKVELDYDTDTVRIGIDVRPDGKAVYKDFSTMKRIGSMFVVFDPNKNVYYSATTHNLALDCLKKIRKWHPAYTTEIERSRFKGAIVMKPARHNHYAKGVLTIVFYREPLKN